MGPSAAVVDLTGDDDDDDNTHVSSTAARREADRKSVNAIIDKLLAGAQPADQKQRIPSSGNIEYVTIDSDEDDGTTVPGISHATTLSTKGKERQTSIRNNIPCSTHLAQSSAKATPTPKKFKIPPGSSVSSPGPFIKAGSAQSSPRGNTNPILFPQKATEATPEVITQETPRVTPLPTKITQKTRHNTPEPDSQTLVRGGNPPSSSKVAQQISNTEVPVTGKTQVFGPQSGKNAANNPRPAAALTEPKPLPLPDGQLPLDVHQTTEIPACRLTITPAMDLPKPDQNLVNQGKGKAPSIVVEKFPPPFDHLGLSMRRPSEASTAVSSIDDVQFTTVLKKHLKEMRDDHESMMKVWLPKNRFRRPTLSPLDSPKESANPCGMMGIKHFTSPFADMRPIQSVKPQQGRSHLKLVAESFSANGSKSGKCTMTAPITTWQDDSSEVPDYMQYTSISQNVLGTNTKQMQAWPYFGEDIVDDTDVYDAMRGRFDVVVDDRPRKVLTSQQARTFAPYFEAFLEEIECPMDDVLRFLLEIAEGDDGLLNRLLEGADSNEVPLLAARKKVNTILSARDGYCRYDFDRTSQRWVSVLSALSPVNAQDIWKAAIACHVFEDVTKFSPWQIARMCARIPETNEEYKLETTKSYSGLACRICHLHDCPYHGANTEHPDGEDSDLESLDTVDKNDTDHPPRINFKQRVTGPSPTHAEAEENATKSSTKPVSWWMNEANSVAWNHNSRGPFFPCHHDGISCSSARCSCWVAKVFCEKACGCAATCDRRFKGCTCGHGKRGRRICLQDDSCACFKMNRECDPDLCSSCGVDEILDPMNRYDDEIGSRKCGNASIQLGRPKRTLLGNSIVHGFGLYAGESIKKDDFVGEYKGEIISKEETERRGVIYEYQKLSYIFDLNQDQMLDSQRLGNKIRYINHAAAGKNSLRNLVPKIVFCNMAHRVAMYAIKDINVGDELFFDYGKGYHEKLFSGQSKEKKQKQKQKAISKTHNSSLIRDFVEPSRPARKSNDYQIQTVEEEPEDLELDEDSEDDDRPTKRVRSSRQPNFKLKGPKPPPPTLRLNRKEDHPHLPKHDTSSVIIPPAVPVPVPVAVPAAVPPPRQKAAIKSAQKSRIADAVKRTVPPKQAARKGQTLGHASGQTLRQTSGHTLAAKLDDMEGDYAFDEHDDESSSEEDDEDEDSEEELPRRSGRKRQKSRKLVSED